MQMCGHADLRRGTDTYAQACMQAYMRIHTGEGMHTWTIMKKYTSTCTRVRAPACTHKSTQLCNPWHPPLRYTAHTCAGACKGGRAACQPTCASLAVRKDAAVHALQDVVHNGLGGGLVQSLLGALWAEGVVVKVLLTAPVPGQLDLHARLILKHLQDDAVAGLDLVREHGATPVASVRVRTQGGSECDCGGGGGGKG